MEMTELKDLLEAVIARKTAQLDKLWQWHIPCQTELEIERTDGERTAYQTILDAINGSTVLRHNVARTDSGA